jgi:hypothetical protein
MQGTCMRRMVVEKKEKDTQRMWMSYHEIAAAAASLAFTLMPLPTND